ncbi:MAG: hypothetical protein AB1782_15320 [Cyanobacteriota bacterium]
MLDKCPQCSKQIPLKEANYCLSCGSSLTDTSKKSPLQKVNTTLILFTPVLTIVNTLIMIIITIIIFSIAGTAFKNVDFIKGGVKAVNEMHERMIRIEETVDDIQDTVNRLQPYEE